MRLTKRKKARKGPLSYKDRAQRPRGAGLVTRREFRQGCNYSKATRKAQRAGFNTMWKHAGPYMRRKRIPRAGEFNKRNIHGGMLWGQRKECPLTDKMAGEIIERVFESGKVGIDQLKQVRHSFSYAYYLTTGTGGDNYPEVKAQWRSFALKDLPAVRRPLVPTKIPIPENLRLAYTKQWSEGTVSLADFETGVMCSHDTHSFGCRPNVDIKKVKVSTNHFINPNEEYGWTEMVGGRSKLHLSKAGTRKWKVYRVCFCKGEHQGPPRRIRMGPDGNLLKGKPTWNTVCPLAAMEFMEVLTSNATRNGLALKVATGDRTMETSRPTLTSGSSTKRFREPHLTGTQDARASAGGSNTSASTTVSTCTSTETSKRSGAPTTRTS